MQTNRVAQRSPTVRNPGKSVRNGARALAVLERPAPPQGWDTSDEHEIELRRWRGRTEITAVEVAWSPTIRCFGTFRTRSESGTAYEVEIRSLDGFDNACGCIDHRVNGLGTCKHIEGVLAGLRRRGVRAFRQAAAEGSPRVEVFLRRSGEPAPTVAWPRGNGEPSGAVRAWLAPYLDAAGQLRAGPDDIKALIDAVSAAPAPVRSHLRVSRHFGPWLERHRRERSRQARAVRFHGRGRAGPREPRHAAPPAAALPARRACCTSRSASARCWPTTWASARPSRRSPPANCCARCKASSACWWSAPPR